MRSLPRRPRCFRFSPLPLLWCCALLLALSSGCAGRVATETIRSGLASGDMENLEQEMEETHESYGEFVTACNLARVYQVGGRWTDAIKAYDDAITLLEAYESRAVVNVRSLLAEAGTILVSRGAEEYYGMGYERSLLHTFNALNYLMLGDFSGAAVEMRRMDQRQAIWLEESQARIEKHLESGQYLDSPENLPSAYSMRDLLRNQEVRELINNYQEPFSYALAAILYRLAGDPQAADVSMRRAVALHGDAELLFPDVWPEKASRTAEPDAGGANDTQEVAVIAFSGLSPSLRVENVRVFLPVIGYLLIDLPSYAVPVSGSRPAAFARHGETSRDITLYPLLRTDVLAYRTLWDEVRMEVSFAISRALTRAGVSAATYAAARSNRNTEGYAPLLSTLATVLMDIFSYAMSGSVRNWETLPNTGYLALADVPRGSAVTVTVNGYAHSVDLPPNAQGAIIMVTELSNANVRMHYVTY